MNYVSSWLFSWTRVLQKALLQCGNCIWLGYKVVDILIAQACLMSNVHACQGHRGLGG